MDFHNAFKDRVLFSFREIKGDFPSFYRARLNNWQDKGYIRKIVRGYYIFADLSVDEEVLFHIANRIYAPSYISLETALSHHGLIPEAVYAMTSVTTKRTYRHKTFLANFYYRTVAPAFFFGYDIIRKGNIIYKMAHAEKALVDFFYFHPDIADEAAFESLRISPINFQRCEPRLLNEYGRRFGQARLSRRINQFVRYVENVKP